MSDKTLELQILTPTGAVAGADGVPTSGVYLPGIQGEIGILPEHIPFLTPLRPGVVRFSSEGQERSFAVGGGFVEVSGGTVTVLSDRVMGVEDLDDGTLRSDYQDCEARLKAAAKENTDTEEFRAIEREFNWLQAQIQLSGPQA